MLTNNKKIVDVFHLCNIISLQFPPPTQDIEILTKNISILQKLFITLYETQRNRYMNNISNIDNTSNVSNISKGDINRLKVVLVEQKRTAKWLAEKIGRDPATVSKWCTNIVQPNLDTLLQVAVILDVDIRDLLCPTK